MFILSDDHIQEAVQIIKSGGIVAHATETCYGFACDLTNQQAVEKLFALKKREGNLPVIALVSSIDQAKEYVEWNEKAQELAEEHWPGPLTIVLQMKSQQVDKSARRQVLSSCRPVDLRPTTLALRISPHPVAQKLAELCDIPISSTSANLHGQPEPYDVEEIRKQFGPEEHQPDLVLDSGKLPQAQPSTVVVVKENGEIEVVREGSVRI